MIIDIHTHIWAPGGSRGLVAAMDARGIDVSVVLPIEPSLDERVYASNDLVFAECRAYPGRLVPFCSLDPARAGALDRLERFVDRDGARGLKLHPPLQAIDLAGEAVRRLLAHAAHLRIPVLVHTGPLFTNKAPLIPNDLYAIDAIAHDVPDVALILAHVDPMGIGPIIVARHANVYCDTAVFWPNAVRLVPTSGDHALDLMGATGRPGWSRLLLGSDANPERSDRLDAALESVRRLGGTDEQRAAMLGGNARRLLRME